MTAPRLTPSQWLRLVAATCFIVAGAVALASTEPVLAAPAWLIAAGLLWSVLTAARRGG